MEVSISTIKRVWVYYFYLLFGQCVCLIHWAFDTRTITNTSSFWRHPKPNSPSYLIKSLIQISYDVFGVLNAGRDPHQAVGYTKF